MFDRFSIDFHNHHHYCHHHHYYHHHPKSTGIPSNYNNIEGLCSVPTVRFSRLGSRIANRRVRFGLHGSVSCIGLSGLCCNRFKVPSSGSVRIFHAYPLIPVHPAKADKSEGVG